MAITSGTSTSTNVINLSQNQRYKSITKKIDVTNLNQRIRNVVAKSETTAVQTLPAS